MSGRASRLGPPATALSETFVTGATALEVLRVAGRVWDAARRPAARPSRLWGVPSGTRVGRCAACAALTLLLAACGPDVITLDVTGRVTDRSTGEPIAGAPVLLTWTRGFADIDAVGTESGADGSYRLFVLRFPCDAPALTVGLDPYEAETVDVRCVETAQTVDFALTSGGSD